MSRIRCSLVFQAFGSPTSGISRLISAAALLVCNCKSQCSAAVVVAASAADKGGNSAIADRAARSLSSVSSLIARTTAAVAAATAASLSPLLSNEKMVVYGTRKHERAHASQQAALKHTTGLTQILRKSLYREWKSPRPSRCRLSDRKQENATLTDRADRQPVSTTDLELAKSLWQNSSTHL